jgi:hypothetical protein
MIPAEVSKVQSALLGAFVHARIDVAISLSIPRHLVRLQQLLLLHPRSTATTEL